MEPYGFIYGVSSYRSWFGGCMPTANRGRHVYLGWRQFLQSKQRLLC